VIGRDTGRDVRFERGAQGLEVQMPIDPAELLLRLETYFQPGGVGVNQFHLIFAGPQDPSGRSSR